MLLYWRIQKELADLKCLFQTGCKGQKYIVHIIEQTGEGAWLNAVNMSTKYNFLINNKQRRFVALNLTSAYGF